MISHSKLLPPDNWTDASVQLRDVNGWMTDR